MKIPCRLNIAEGNMWLIARIRNDVTAGEKRKAFVVFVGWASAHADNPVACKNSMG
jgi:hypothetical protein